MDDAKPRPAKAADVDAISALVRAAYAKYVPRMETEPLPMTADYGKAVREEQVWVLEDGGEIVAVLGLVPGADHLLIENVAVAPEQQGRGLGRKLLAFAEKQALGQGLREMRLYTAEAMSENVTLYSRIGYRETERKTVSEIPRVYMSKRLSG